MGIGTVPSCAIERVICFSSSVSNCLNSREARGFPMQSSKAAALSGPFKTLALGPLFEATGEAIAYTAVLASPAISVRETPSRALSSSTTTISPRAMTRPFTMISTGSPLGDQVE